MFRAGAVTKLSTQERVLVEQRALSSGAWVFSPTCHCRLVWNSVIGALLSNSSHTKLILCHVKPCKQTLPFAPALVCGLKRVDGSGVGILKHLELCRLEIWFLFAF